MDTRKSIIDIYLNYKPKKGVISFYHKNEEGEVQKKELSEANFLLLESYMTIKGDNGDKRVYSNMELTSKSDKVYKLVNCPSYPVVHWKNMSADQKKTVLRGDSRELSHVLVLIVMYENKIAALDISGSSQSAWFDFTKKLRSDGVEKAEYGQIRIKINAKSETVTVGKGSKTSEIHLPEFSYKDASSDDVEIAEELYEKQKEHYLNMKDSNSSYEEDYSDDEPDNNEPDNSEEKETIDESKIDQGAYKRAQEDLEFCHSAEDISRDWSRFRPRYAEFDSATFNAIVDLWQSKFEAKGGDGVLDMPF